MAVELILDAQLDTWYVVESRLKLQCTLSNNRNGDRWGLSIFAPSLLFDKVLYKLETLINMGRVEACKGKMGRCIIRSGATLEPS